jgi:hypothetical protein
MAPCLSFVAGSRNDDHGGNLLHRMQVFVEALLGQCDRHGLDAELVLVEWNPPPGRPRLSEALIWPETERCAVRIVEVPPELHRRFDNADALPLHQMIAKNVGIRRARGTFVVATNVDVVFSDDLMAFMAGGGLEAEYFYRTERFDVDAGVPVSAPLEEQLAYCRGNLLRIHARNGTRDIKTGLFNRIYRPAGLLKALSWLPASLLPASLGRYTLSFFRTFGHLNTNGCGDFTLTARQNWERLGGYWEFAGYPLHVDGLFCYAAHFSGLREIELPPPACIYHIEHGQGTGFSGYVSGEKCKDLDANEVPYIGQADYVSMLGDIKEGRHPLAMNGADWGFGNETLEEFSP